MSVTTRAVGAPVERLEGREKVQGQARYAYEHTPEGTAYAVGVSSAVARGTLRGVDDTAALQVPGVLAVLHHGNAPRLHELDDGELAIFQSDRVAYRGQLVAAVVAESLEAAREAQQLLRLDYAAEQHDVVLRADHPGLYTPEKVNPGFPTDTDQGD